MSTTSTARSNATNAAFRVVLLSEQIIRAIEDESCDYCLGLLRQLDREWHDLHNQIGLWNHMRLKTVTSRSVKKGV